MDFRSMFISVLLLLLVLGIWLVLQPRRNQATWQKIAEIALFFGVCCASVMTSGGALSNYKFLFIFIVVTYTFQFSTVYGMGIAAASACVLFGLDFVQRIRGFALTTFESDFALSIMFFIISFIIGRYVALDRRHIEGLTRMANVDGLTEVYNHRYFHDALRTQVEEAAKTKQPLSLIMLDIDYFKVYNDMYGHQEGDKALRKVAEVIRDMAGKDAVTCRYGGEEFSVILPNTDENRAAELAERMRVAIAETEIEGDKYMPDGALTISLGVSSLQGEDDTPDEMIYRADAALYRVKYLRKNSVETYHDVFDRLAPNDNVRDALMSVRGLVSIINHNDNYTYSHTERVAMCCEIIARRFSLDEEDARKLVLAAYMHDIGKVNVAKEVLISNRRLTDEEYEQIKLHPMHSKAILERIEGMEEIAEIVAQHHERWDGTGYPNHLKGEEIHPIAMLLSLADSYDAMTNNRPYQRKCSVQEALDKIRENAGTQFHPELAMRFIRAMEDEEKEKSEK